MKSQERRKRLRLSKEEINILKVMLVKILVPFFVVTLLSSLVIFFGLHSLLKETSFCNYGIAPKAVSDSVSHFITIYIVIFCINIVLMLSLSAFIFNLALQKLALPIMRITRDLTTGSPDQVQIRKNDILLVPLARAINKLIGKKNK